MDKEIIDCKWLVPKTGDITENLANAINQIFNDPFAHFKSVKKIADGRYMIEYRKEEPVIGSVHPLGS